MHGCDLSVIPRRCAKENKFMTSRPGISHGPGSAASGHSGRRCRRYADRAGRERRGGALLGLGQGCAVRERRQLGHQHRQRLLRRPAVQPQHLARLRRHAAPRTTPAVSSRSPWPSGCSPPRAGARGRCARARPGRPAIVVAVEARAQGGSRRPLRPSPRRRWACRQAAAPVAGGYTVQPGDTLSSIAAAQKVAGGWNVAVLDERAAERERDPPGSGPAPELTRRPGSQQGAHSCDWVAGMCTLLRRAATLRPS